MRQDGGARVRRGAEPQVSQHLLHEDTGHVDKDRETQSLRWPQRRGLLICCGTTVGDGSTPLVFFTLTPVGFEPTKVLKFSFLIIIVIIVVVS